MIALTFIGIVAARWWLRRRRRQRGDPQTGWCINVDGEQGRSATMERRKLAWREPDTAIRHGVTLVFDPELIPTALMDASDAFNAPAAGMTTDCGKPIPTGLHMIDPAGVNCVPCLEAEGGPLERRAAGLARSQFGSVS